MHSLLQTVEKELNISKNQLIKEGMRHFLSAELRSLSIEIRKHANRYKVDSFEQLWQKLESGEITEKECFDDLIKLEYLELEREKIMKLLNRVG